MNLPPSLTQKQVEDTVNKIIDRCAHKYVFHNFDKEDIEQQAWLEALKAVPKFDPTKGKLEHFLANHIRKRLLNYKRDHYFQNDNSEREMMKKNILHTLDIGEAYEVVYDDEDLVDGISYKELLSKIRRSIPSSLRSDFERLRSGIQLPKSRRLKVIEAVKKILGEEEYVQSQEVVD